MGQGVLASSEQCDREVGLNIECGHEMALDAVCSSGAFRNPEVESSRLEQHFLRGQSDCVS